MYMICHDNIGINIQFFVLLAKGKVFNYKVVILPPGKDVYPINYG